MSDSLIITKPLYREVFVGLLCDMKLTLLYAHFFSFKKNVCQYLNDQKMLSQVDNCILYHVTLASKQEVMIMLHGLSMRTGLHVCIKWYAQ